MKKYQVNASVPLEIIVHLDEIRQFSGFRPSTIAAEMLCDLRSVKPTEIRDFLREFHKLTQRFTLRKSPAGDRAEAASSQPESPGNA